MSSKLVGLLSIHAHQCSYHSSWGCILSAV